MIIHQQEENRKKIRIMRFVLTAGLIITAGKFFAYWATNSNAILTDAFESIINIIAAAFGLFSLVYAARPRDENHPYGHGKMEFIAVGFEGALILLAGGGMTVKAVYSIFHPQPLEQLDTGLIITSAAAGLNFLMGKVLVSKGKELHSSALVADGKHLLSDTWSSAALLAGLILIQWTGYNWIDTVLTILLGIYILVVGFRLVMNSMAGLMDEADFDKLNEIVEVINKERKDSWIDVHNLRVVKYGGNFHIDAHLTLPWYEDLNKTHQTVKEVETVVNAHFGNRVEFFIHTDPCLPTSCPICSIKNCPVRKHEFAGKLEWDLKILLQNKPHTSKA